MRKKGWERDVTRMNTVLRLTSEQSGHVHAVTNVHDRLVNNSFNLLITFYWILKWKETEPMPSYIYIINTVTLKYTDHFWLIDYKLKKYTVSKNISIFSLKIAPLLTQWSRYITLFICLFVYCLKNKNYIKMINLSEFWWFESHFDLLLLVNLQGVAYISPDNNHAHITCIMAFCVFFITWLWHGFDNCV